MGRGVAGREASLCYAQREAKNAFGDDASYIEKFIVGPRHVEIQLLADSHGNYLSLGERECSVQRRHQKMIEEAPSVAVSSDLRSARGETAIRVARAAGYVNAGTCEVPLAADANYYFLETNTRLQVEHPVTELVSGLDLVQWQIRIAAGERLPVAPLMLEPRGWAIEWRLASEDAGNDFHPFHGLLPLFGLPGVAGFRWVAGVGWGRWGVRRIGGGPRCCWMFIRDCAVGVADSAS